MREIYLGGTQGVKPSFTTSTGQSLEQEAREKLSPEAYGYVAGGEHGMRGREKFQ